MKRSPRHRYTLFVFSIAALAVAVSAPNAIAQRSVFEENFLSKESRHHAFDNITILSGHARHRHSHALAVTNQSSTSPASSTGGSVQGPLITLSGNTTTWNGGGGDNNWGTSGNWVGGTTPSGGGDDIINFAGTTRLTPNNNYGAFTQYQSIFFNSGAGAFTLNGNDIKYYGKIQNDSSNLQTVNFASIVLVGGSASTVNQFNPVSGDLTVNNSIFLDNTSTLNVFGNNGHVLTFTGAISNGNATGRVTVNENSTVIFKGANTYSGETDILAGAIRVDVAPTGGGTTGTYFVGNGAATGTAATLNLGGGTSGTSGGVTLSNAVTENAGSSGNRVIGGTNTTGTNTYSGTVTITDGNATLRAATNGTVAFNTITASAARIVAVGGGGNNGTVSFTGSSDNTNIGATVNSGTLLLAKTSSGGVHAVGAGLTVNSGGTVMLGGTGADQIFDSMAVTLNGGTFNTNSKSEGTAGAVGVGALTLSSTSIINLSGTDVLHFAASNLQTWTGTLNIYNWNGTPVTGGGTEEILFGTNALGLNATQLLQIQFYSDAGSTAYTPGAVILSTGEIVPVPEPGTWVAGGLAAAAVLLTQRRRLSRLLKRAA